MIDYKRVIKNRELRLKLISMLSWIPNRPYLKMVYRIKTGRKLNLDNPQGFNEKLNWLKLNDIHPEYTNLADKIIVRDYIKSSLGEEYLIPILGVWNSFADIEFDKLPNSFVLKCNHDSGSVKIIHDKSEIDLKKLKKFFDERMHINPYILGREYPYREIKPRIFAEKLMKTSDGLPDLRDYKFFCFSGKPRFLYVSEGLSNHDTAKINYVMLNWEKAPFRRVDFCEFDRLPHKPKNYNTMIEICEKLSKDMPFVRVDLYSIDDAVYFSEFTFFPSGGFQLMSPDEWERKLGDLIETNTL